MRKSTLLLGTITLSLGLASFALLLAGQTEAAMACGTAGCGLVCWL